MATDSFGQPGLDSFWEEADREGSSEHPLARELGFHLDALARYRRLADEAEADGRDQAAALLLDHCRREEEVIRALEAALRRLPPRR